MRCWRIGASGFRTIVGGLALAVLGACGPPGASVRYTGINFGRQPKGIDAMEVFRGNVPSGRFQDLGTVTVRCPSQGEFGGCEYDWAVRQAALRAASEGGDGIHSIDSAVNASGRVVSLNASAFVRLPPLVSSPPPLEDQKPTVEERLRQLDKLKQDGLINQDEYDQKRQQILNDI